MRGGSLDHELQNAFRWRRLGGSRRNATTSAFLIPAPQSHKSRKSSRARFSTLFSCAIRRAALAGYCAIKNVHFRWYYTCAVSRQVYRHGVGLFTSKFTDREVGLFTSKFTDREISDLGAIKCR
jgi:hypothetical protein